MNFAKKKLIKDLLNDVFYEYDIDLVYERDAVDWHMMSCEHTEILGQFIDYTGMDVEQLKCCLITGLVQMNIDRDKYELN